jgi:mono/diheme cytochrome c family protein
MQEKTFLQKAVKIVPISLALVAVFWFGGSAIGLSSAVIERLAGIVLVAMTYALLLAIPKTEFKEKSFFQNLKLKIPIIIVISIIIWMVAGKMGFPIWWQIEFVAFAIVALIFFVVLDLKAMKPEKSQWQSVVRLIGTYALPSVLFIVITAQLPQFDPQFELDKLNRPPVKLSGLAGPEVIAAGRDVFEQNKCFNCHKVFWEGNSDRGPNLGTKQIGLYGEDYIKEQILEPRKNQSPGFEDKKSKKAMPTYYGEDLSEDELSALVAYLKTMRDPTHMPVEGKFPDQWTWWDDAQIVAEGQVVFEGAEPATEGLNCAVCHGTDGTPMMTGALDFRKEDNPDTTKMPDHLPNVVLKDWPDALWYKRVTRGVDGTPMAPWGSIFPHLYLWKAEAYARTFHDPLDKRAEKRPVPPVPSKEEVESWKTDGLFLDPLL